jgi:hypothetical protein
VFDARGELGLTRSQMQSLVRELEHTKRCAAPARNRTGLSLVYVSAEGSLKNVNHPTTLAMAAVAHFLFN